VIEIILDEPGGKEPHPLKIDELHCSRDRSILSIFDALTFCIAPAIYECSIWNEAAPPQDS
jgi:hypothetical protein